MTERSLNIGRIEQIRDLAAVQKVEGMLVQEWELVQLCELALELLDQYGAEDTAPEVERKIEWISVKDRLPQDNRDVMFWDETGFCVGFKVRDDADSMEWRDKLAVDRDGDYQDTYTVTHWAPLPSSPPQSSGS